MKKEDLFDFDRIVDRRRTASLKWDKYKDPDIIPLWVADMDFTSPPEVLEALHARVDHGVFGYTLPPEDLAGTVVEVLRHEYLWNIEPDWIVWLPGLVTGLNVSCRAVGADGEHVMTTVPVYPPFLSAPKNSRRGLVTAPMVLERGRWLFDFERMASAVTPETRMFILCNPHNPLGRVFDRNELVELAEFCISRKIVICSDEIHCGLILDPDKKHRPIASLDPEIGKNTLTLMAPSKTYNIPGLGCSFAVIPDAQLRKSFHIAMAGIVPHVNTLGYTAAAAAYRFGGAWREAVIDYLRGNRDRVFQVIQETGTLRTSHVEATYLAWIDARQAAEDPVRFFENAGVGLSDGADFGTSGFVRLNFGCSRSLLDIALERMMRAIRRSS